MVQISTPRLLISGVCSGAGKSFFTIGLVQELRRRGLSVACCVVGPAVIEATILRRLSGRYVRTLDDRLLSARQNLHTIAEASLGADIMIIEGKEGLYDGYGAGTTRGSDSELAALTSTPVLLVVNAKGFGTSVVALLRGYAAMAKGFALCGTVFNRVERGDFADVRDRDYFEATLQSCGLHGALLGAIPEIANGNVLSCETISQQKNLSLLPRQFLIDCGEAVARGIDVPAIIARAKQAPPLEVGEVVPPSPGRRSRIAVSDDSCFNVGFQDNQDLLRYYGAELVPFSPLADERLPKKIGAVYLTGASLPDYATELSANHAMRQALLEYVQAGGILFSEGGASAYLAQEFAIDNSKQVFQGVGVLPGRAVVGPLCPRYVEAETIEESIFGAPGQRLKCIISDEWRLEHEPRMVRAFRLSSGDQNSMSEGYSPGAQVICTFGFVQFGANPGLASALVEGAEVGGAVGDSR